MSTLLPAFAGFACWRFAASACIAAGPNCNASFLTSVRFRHITKSKPYIFSETELVKLLRAASGLERNPLSPLRPEVIRLAILLLFTTGIRRGELLNLMVGDYSRRETTLHVRETKFYKSRLLPINGGIADEIDCYLRTRSVADQWFGSPVFGDLREETVFDGIPFGSTGGLMRDGSGDAKWVAQLNLDFSFPSP